MGVVVGGVLFFLIPIKYIRRSSQEQGSPRRNHNGAQSLLVPSEWFSPPCQALGRPRHQRRVAFLWLGQEVNFGWSNILTMVLQMPERSEQNEQGCVAFSNWLSASPGLSAQCYNFPLL